MPIGLIRMSSIFFIFTKHVLWVTVIGGPRDTVIIFAKKYFTYLLKNYKKYGEMVCVSKLQCTTK